MEYACIMINHSLHTCIVPLLISFLFSQKLHHILLVQMAAMTGNDTFLDMFSTPTLLWRVLHFMGYMELSRYFWTKEYLEGQPWFEVQLTIPAHTQAPLWQEWKADSEGKLLGKVPK